MAPLVAAAQRTIAAPAETLYDYVADFREHHPRFLPPAFSDFTVETGGIGVGTETSSRMTLGGRTQDLRTRVSRVEQGRLIEEVVLDQPMTTTFTFVPNGAGATVRIETTWQAGGGVSGLLERLFAPRLLARVYEDELGRLEAYAASRP
ncbi:MAG TPA: SRPBCC family protein [Candidatus Deferrimicrobium sp.]|nr:SRPBCC family protein [Candidatus Deferrimicrobium sp.]